MRSPVHPQKARRGFTLIEVLVAIAILGIGLTAIFSSQWVSFASVKHARYMNESAGLVRCKMSEVEWQLEQDGYQVSEVNETGACCEGVEDGEYSCSWTVAPVEFPQAQFGDLDLDAELDFGSGPSLFGGGPTTGAAPGAAALGFLKSGNAAMGQAGDVSGIADSFLGGTEGAADGVAGLVMQIVYPDLKAIFEAGTRKIIVTVSWIEGRKEYSRTLEQWVTSSKAAGIGANMAGLLATDDEDEEGNPIPPGTTPPGQRTPGQKAPTGNPFLDNFGGRPLPPKPGGGK